MVMDQNKIDALVVADGVLRGLGGHGIDQAGIMVLGGSVTYNGEKVAAPKMEAPKAEASKVEVKKAIKAAE